MERKSQFLVILIVILALFLLIYWLAPQLTYTSNPPRSVKAIFNLPEPQITQNLSLDEAIQQRRSIRNFTNQTLSLQDVSQILWAAQGITDPERNFRASPSAGHVYPLELYLITGDNTVQGLPSGLYHYDPVNNRLEKILAGDIRFKLSQVANNQRSINQAPSSIIITGIYQKMIDKYEKKDLSIRFVHLEAGHAGENIYLEATNLGLGTVAIGSFNEENLKNLLKLPQNETPLYIYPIGFPAP